MVYQAFQFAPYENYGPLKISTLKEGIEDLQEKREATIRQKRIYERMMVNSHLEYEDLFQTSASIDECEKTIEQVDEAIGDIKLLIRIADEYADEDVASVMEWRIA